MGGARGARGRCAAHVTLLSMNTSWAPTRAPPSSHALPTASRSCSTPSWTAPASARPEPTHTPCSWHRLAAGGPGRTRHANGEP
eukprot:3939538-Prymnesium_polylepis.2